MESESAAGSFEELVGRQRPGFALERPFYTDAAIFERDLERIVARQWLLVDHVSRLARAGDYLTYEIAGESIILVRGRDGEVRAFFNVCRHRGSRICLKPEGNVRTLTCPYHAWVWDLEGRLLHARGMADGFDTTPYPLHACRVRAWQGLIFVNLAGEGDGEALDFDAIARDCAPYLATNRLEQARVVATRTYPTAANWKLVVENFVECHHCAPSHPEYTGVHSYVLDEERDPEAWSRRFAAWQDAWRGRGHHVDIVNPGLTDRRQPHGGWHVPIRDGFRTLSRDGAPLAPLMGDLVEFDGGDAGIVFGPLSYAHLCNDHAVLFRFTPVTPRDTEVVVSWLVRADAVEGRDFDVDRLTWLWDVTTLEDTRIINDNQAGVSSRRYVPGPYTPSESYTDSFVRWYLGRVA